MAKTYFVVSDVHSYYTQLRYALTKSGFQSNNTEHILIVCGDAFDRGNESWQMLKFLYRLHKANRLVYIKGNHEELLQMCKNEMDRFSACQRVHYQNGTYKTWEAIYKNDPKLTKMYEELMEHMVDYYELGKYIFVHGWIPYTGDYMEPSFNKNWKKGNWKRARWENGMEMWHKGIKVPHKIIVCGHWHTGWGHYMLHNKGETQYDCYDIFKDKGIIALDACTAITERVNVLIIHETDLDNKRRV